MGENLEDNIGMKLRELVDIVVALDEFNKH